MHDQAFIEYLESNKDTKRFVDFAMRAANSKNKPIQDLVPGIYRDFLKQFEFLEDIEIRD
ncbi:MAG: hypothetical protein AABX32_01655 [Nanoarchaeota archaeon]|jgi:hypothetical protein